MKAIVIVILGSLPLAAGSVWSLVELATVGGRVPRPPEAAPVEAQIAMTDECLARVEADRPAAVALAKAELLNPRVPQELAAVPDDGGLKQLGEAWGPWAEALQQAEALADAAGNVAAGDLAALEKAAAEMERLKAKLAESSIRSKKPVLKAIGKRIGQIQTRIARIEREREAAELVAQAKAAFSEKEYARCTKVCDELQSKFANVLESAALGDVKALRGRAQFWQDSAQLATDLQAADTLSRKKILLEAFLKKYPDRPVDSDSERKALDQNRVKLAGVVKQIESAVKEQAAAKSIESLRSALPATFAERVKRAAEIVRKHDTPASRETLRSEVRSWVGEFLPPEAIQESPRLQEVETVRHQIVRGYFTRVNAPRGYKCYPTYEQSIRPVSEVGTYLANQLLGGPAATLPRRSVTRYATARKLLVENPGSRPSWEQFAAVCEQLDEEMARYREKPGSSQEDLSFAEQARFARDQLASPGWENLTVLFNE